MASAAWLKQSGWWLARGTEAKATHLLLDGGKARVPDESAGAFLNAYAIAVVKGVRPCVVELRTPVFKLFFDLDVKTKADLDLDFGSIMRTLQSSAVAFFAEDCPRAVVCTTDPKQCADYTKQGRHVVWTDIFVTAPTALAFREAVIQALDEAHPEACAAPWTSVVDACVFRANGLRMPFSAKGRDNPSVYRPVEVWTGGESKGVGEVTGVSEVRRWARELSIRAFMRDETPVREGIDIPVAEDGAVEALRGTSKSLKEYEVALPQLDAALPIQFTGQRFTSIIRTESCFLLRSSSRYCLNRGGTHNTCGVYFILTLKGVRQACYCRCDSTEGRKYGHCKDFKSDIWPVPDEVLVAFFGTAHTHQPEFKLPSAKALTVASLEDLLSRSRPPLKASRKRKKPAAAKK